MNSSEQLTELVESRLAQLAERAPRTAALLDAQAGLALQARQVLLGSDFALRAMGGDDTSLEMLWREGALDAGRSAADYVALVEALHPDEVANEVDALRLLRVLRQREMLRLVWRDLSGAAPVHATLRETSWLADSIIAGAARMAAALLAARHGRPAPAGDELMVLAMGKLGGSELNFSSDVDLIFIAPQGGQTDGPAPLALEEYFTRQGRLLIRLLEQATEDGFAFRVDMRLRPFGDSGPLVASEGFLEDYLQAHGRDWERYAWVKARAITATQRFETLHEELIRPFVFRRYLDFGVFEALREMKALISRDVQRRDRAASIKLGAGGIREIEFIVQAFQLVRGGNDATLREPSLLTILPRLAGERLLPPEVVEELQQAYDFMRRLENRVQMLDDAQTHELPSEPLSCQRVAAALGFADVPAMQEELRRHCARVQEHFAALFSDGQAKPSAALDLSALWEAGLDRAPLAEQLAQFSDDGADLLARLEELIGSSSLRRLDEIGRRRLKLLLELLLAEQDAARDAGALRRIFGVLEAIGLRSAYFSLLVENRDARTRLVEVALHGDFLAGQLARNPALLDELLGERWLDGPADRDGMAAELAARLGDLQPDDIERQVEQLSRFKRAAVFRIALADLFGRLPLMQVSDRLTEIAGLIVQQVMELGLRQTAAQYGMPGCTVDGQRRPVHIAALAYGKLGGYELGYGSDLDLVFLHDSIGEQQETDAAVPVDNQVFFLRYAQRLIHLLTMHSPAGRLYEIDVRLRPSGKGGMLVTSIEAFRRYQFEEAWTWEHQALLHARAVAGDAALMLRIELVRMEVLEGAVRRDDLREQIRNMRERQRRELAQGGEGTFDLKHDRGGIADIEFLAQYWALRWAAEYPPLVHFPDTIRQLESVASIALVPQETVDVLVRAYQHYRHAAHRRALEQKSGAVEAAGYEADRAAVAAIWRTAMEEPV